MQRKAKANDLLSDLSISMFGFIASDQWPNPIVRARVVRRPLPQSSAAWIPYSMHEYAPSRQPTKV